jgi:hypothetical protein
MPHARLTTIAFLLAAGCSAEPRNQAPAPPSSDTQQEHKVTKPMQGRLTQFQALIGLDQQAFIDRFGIQPEHIRTAATYEGMKEVTEIYHPNHADLGAARFFFRNGKLELIYISDATVLSVSELDAIVGDPAVKGTVLRSRAGKTSNLHVYADRGFAISKGKKIDFIEIFRPTTQQDYEQTIYVAPGPFKL